MSTIRTAQAFGTQNVLAALYDVPVHKAFDIDGRAAISQGFGLASFFFAIYAAYALGQFAPLSIPFAMQPSVTDSLTAYTSVLFWHHTH